MWLHSRFMSTHQVFHRIPVQTCITHFTSIFLSSDTKKATIIGLWVPQNQSRIKTTHVLQISCIYYRQLPVAFLIKPLRSSGTSDGMFVLVFKASYNEIIYSKLSVWAFQSGQQTRGWPLQQFCFFSVEQCSHLPQHNLLEQVLSHLGCFFLLTSLHQHPKRSNIEIILLDGSYNMLHIAQQETLSCCQMSNAQQEALSCCQCSKQLRLKLNKLTQSCWSSRYSFKHNADHAGFTQPFWTSDFNKHEGKKTIDFSALLIIYETTINWLARDCI